ncbi:MAG: T9SS type A sorting domain-containing protein [Saprospiraceae bacterium]|nr:T9SS type A sorting domain-containing protein [Saprospiraceae bacterium]MBP6238188.1 T9SS type A sorting domain-containing protein [Saprospiraceae bacterium]MBP6566995.1 T9SS type A sorting domain-containing protein [Saprospiraceae bacterium]
MNIAPLNPGLYLIKCTTSSGVVSTHKFVKQ